jgi:hypothetical protein
VIIATVFIAIEKPSFKNTLIFFQERDFVTKEEMYEHLTKEMADYCLSKMKIYTDPRTGQEVREAYDYMEYTRTLFQNGSSVTGSP